MTTGHFRNSCALAYLVHRLALKDTWQQNPVKPTFTHYSPSGATRRDRLYMSQEMMAKKQGIEILPAAFTDHHAVVLCTARGAPIVRRSRGRWKMNLALIQERIKRKIQHKWATWVTHKRYHHDATLL